jgi:uncharacterized protein YjbK
MTYNEFYKILSFEKDKNWLQQNYYVHTKKLKLIIVTNSAKQRGAQMQFEMT